MCQARSRDVSGISAFVWRGCVPTYIQSEPNNETQPSLKTPYQTSDNVRYVRLSTEKAGFSRGGIAPPDVSFKFM